MEEIAHLIGPPQPHVIETEVRGDISLYNPRDESVLVLNPTASDVWRLCDGEQTFEEIVSMLAAAYGTEAAAIRADVQRTIEQFASEGFLDQT